MRLDSCPVRAHTETVTTTKQVRTNNFPGDCRTCRRTVPAGDGRLLNMSGGRRGAKPVWKIECLDREACQAAYDALPSTIAKVERAASKLAGLRAEATEKLAKLEAAGRVPDAVGGKTVTMPNGETVKRRNLKNGYVRLDFGGELKFDHVSDEAATVFLAGRWDWDVRQIEGDRIHALPMPPVGTIYDRQYRHGCRNADGTEIRVTGRSMFLGTAFVSGVGEMAICAEELEDGSWLGYRDNLHTVKRGWAGELKR